LTLLRYEVTVKVQCAWCEKEGKETLIGEVGLYDGPMTSHGICGDHEKVVLKQIAELRIKRNPRVYRRKHSRSKSVASTPLLASRKICIQTPTRRRLLKNLLSSAQLQLPFNDFQDPPLAGNHISAIVP
jgi:hypothetical protein